ncbi:MAG: heavy metal translocating P-type ATPase [Thiolinea sp.]
MITTTALTAASGFYLGAKAFGLLPTQKKQKIEQLALEQKEKIGNLVTQITDKAPETVEQDEEGREIKVVGEDEPELTPEEEKEMIDHYFKVSSAVLGVSTITIVTVPAAHVLAIPALLYTLVPVFFDAAEGLKKNQLRPSLVDSVAVTSAIGLGMVNNLNPYFFAAGAVGTWMYFLSAKLVMQTKDKSIKELTNLFGEQARSVWLIKDGVEIEIPFEDVKVGDIVVVSAGEMIPVDGAITDGTGSIDQRMLTGESQPIEKGIGEEVFAATTLLTGKLKIEVLKAGQDAVAAQIGEIWNQTADYRTSVETRGEQLSNKAVLPTLGAGGLALLTLGPISATAVLLSNFSDAIQLASPLSTLNFLHLASKDGILIKDGRALEGLKTIDTIVFDKTGTLTLDQPHVGEVHIAGRCDANTLLTYAAAAEHKQTHPVARAIIAAAKEKKLQLPPMDEASYQVGYGIKAKINGHWVRVGSDRFMKAENIAIPTHIKAQQARSHEQGHTLIMVAIDNELSGALSLYPTIRPEAKEIVRQLKERGLSLCIISGDHEKPTRALANELGIDQYFAETLPEDKATLIGQLQEEGRSVCFIGDGINDTIALKRANVSISLSGATSAAMDTAQIIMMDGRLVHLDTLFGLSGQYDENLSNGFKMVLGGSVVCVGGVFLFHFGIFSALTLQGMTLAASIGNSYLPKLREVQSKKKLQADSAQIIDLDEASYIDKTQRSTSDKKPIQEAA